MRTIIIVLLACLNASFAAAQAPQTNNTTPTADQLFAFVPGLSNGSPANQFARLSCPDVVNTPTTLVNLFITKEIENVRLAARLITKDANGKITVGHAFYASRDLSLTNAGPGYFPKLVVASVVPLGDVSAANFGGQTFVQAGIFDAENSRLLGPVLERSFISIPPVAPVPWKDCMACSSLFTCTAGLPGGSALTVSCSKLVPNSSRLINLGNGLCVHESLCEEITQSGNQTTTGGTTGLVPDCACQFVNMTSQSVRKYPGGTTWREGPAFSCGK